MYLRSPGNQYVFCLFNKLFFDCLLSICLSPKGFNSYCSLKTFSIVVFYQPVCSKFSAVSVAQFLNFFVNCCLLMTLHNMIGWYGLETVPIMLLLGFYWSVTSLRSKLRLIQIKLELAGSSYLARLKRTMNNVLIDDSTRMFYFWAENIIHIS